MKTWQDGPYIFIMQISPLKETNTKVKRTTSDGLQTVPSPNPEEMLFTSKAYILLFYWNFVLQALKLS